MKQNFYLPIVVIISCFMSIVACMIDTRVFSLTQTSALTNFQSDKEKKLLILDYTNAIDSGFIIPSINQTNSGYFHFNFKITNLKSGPSKFLYKIF